MNNKTKIASSIGELVMFIVCMILGNVLYQALTVKDWYVAIERSYFQALALAIFGLSFYNRGRGR